MIKYIWKAACAGMLFLGLLFSSCANEDYSIGGHLVNSHTRLEITDTISIRVSNLVSVDSVVTSGNNSNIQGTGFSGIYDDPYVGTFQTQTFIEFSNTTDVENYRYAQFDSVTLVLRPNGNYYGDTVKYAAFKVSKLTERIEKQDNGNLYSTSNMPIGEQLADTALKVKVKAMEPVEIKLPRSFGEWLFNGALLKDDAFNSDNYRKTFPGLSISSGTGSNCVHGLNIQDSACMIRIYYHVSTIDKEDKTMTFKASPGNSFYQLNNDKAKLPFYNSKSDPMPSRQTDNMGVIMSGTPMYTRLEFPHLNELLTLGQIVKIKEARLYVRPVSKSFETVPLPSELNLYYFDPTSNTPLSSAITLPSSSSRTPVAQTGNLPKDYQNLWYPEFPQYSFDVTDFISSQLGKSGYNKWALCLLVPESSHGNTIQRLVFGNQDYWYKSENQSKDNRIKIEITYVVYND